MTEVPKLIARAIRKADKSYFFEDYDKQAKAVMKRLEEAGYAITKCEADMSIFEQVAKEMKTGRMKPEEHIKNVYQQVLKKLRA